jgi:hypothetical protein
MGRLSILVFVHGLGIAEKSEYAYDNPHTSVTGGLTEVYIGRALPRAHRS